MNHFLKQHKYFILAFLVFAVLAVVSGYQSFKISNNKFEIPNININSNNQLTNTSTSININPANTTTQSTTNPSTPQTTIPSTTSETVEQLNYTIEVNDYKFLTATSTVYELMMHASADSRRPFGFTTKHFPGMGEFVEEINGVKNDSQTGKYLVYYINGKSAQAGISVQLIKPNDIIEWKYVNQGDVF
jgi:hypothetical protein